jgi:hypothetical protein
MRFKVSIQEWTAADTDAPRNRHCCARDPLKTPHGLYDPLIALAQQNIAISRLFNYRQGGGDCLDGVQLELPRY